MKVKKFEDINEQNSLSESSIDDLIEFKECLEFVTEYEVEILDALDCLDKLLKWDWKEIQDERVHLITNYSRSNKDEFMIKLIDSYCSNVVDN